MSNTNKIVNDIPDDWKFLKNKYIFEKRKEKVNENYRNFQLLSLTTKGVRKKDIETTGGKLPESFNTYQRVYKKDLILCLFDLDVSAVFSGLSNFDGMITSAYDVFKVKKGFNEEFLKYLFDLYKYDRYYIQYSKSLRKTINTENFLSIATLVPPFQTQQKIANLLAEKISRIDKIIEETNTSIEELKKYKQSLITEIVTKGLDKNVEMKDSGIEWIGEIPKDWEVKKLKFICVESKEYLSNKEDKDLEFNYIDIGSVSYDKGIIKNEKLKFINAPSRARKIINNEDVIISSVRTYLKAITVIENLSEFTVASTGFIVLKTTNNTNYEYLSYLLKSNFFTSKVQSLSEGITYPAIVTSKLMNIKVPIPALNEQIKLKNYLNLRTEKIDLLIEKKMNLIKEYESYKKSLIYEYVTGKKEVGEEVE